MAATILEARRKTERLECEALSGRKTALDRLLHKSTVMKIQGESYRLREKHKAGINLGEIAMKE